MGSGESTGVLGFIVSRVGRLEVVKRCDYGFKGLYFVIREKVYIF